MALLSQDAQSLRKCQQQEHHEHHRLVVSHLRHPEGQKEEHVGHWDLGHTAPGQPEVSHYEQHAFVVFQRQEREGIGTLVTGRPEPSQVPTAGTS